MSSSEEAAALALISKWNDCSSEIQVVLTGGDEFRFRIEGAIEDWLDGKLRVAGSKCDCFLDLSEASFRDVVTEEGMKESGLSPETYPESVTVTLLPVGKFMLSALPKLRPDFRPN